MHGRAASFDRARLRRDCLEIYGHKAVVRQLESIYARVLGTDDAGGTA